MFVPSVFLLARKQSIFLCYYLVQQRHKACPDPASERLQRIMAFACARLVNPYPSKGQPSMFMLIHEQYAIRGERSCPKQEINRTEKMLHGIQRKRPCRTPFASAHFICVVLSIYPYSTNLNLTCTALDRRVHAPSPKESSSRCLTQVYMAAGTSAVHRTERGLAASTRRWSSGRIRPCHGRDPGSIPGRRTVLTSFVFTRRFGLFVSLAGSFS